MSADDWTGKSDDQLRHWHGFHTRRIARESARADGHRNYPNDLMSDDYRASLIEQCELSIHHSRRHLAEIKVEAERRGIDLGAVE